MVRKKRMAAHKFASARRMRANPTPAERVLWETLKGKACGFKVRRQSPMWGYIADFYVAKAKLVIEVDGGYHQDEIDARRDAILQSKGLRTLRFRNDAVLTNPAAVVAKIRDEVSRTAQSPQ